MPRSDEARARNEELKAKLNTQLHELNEAFSSFTEIGEWICECDRGDCLQTMSLTLAEYDQLRTHPRQFAVVPDHVDAAIEEVVARREAHVIVRKFGPAGQHAERTHPRTPDAP